jgi:uncharacterized protein (DUF3820 family)
MKESIENKMHVFGVLGHLHGVCCVLTNAKAGTMSIKGTYGDPDLIVKIGNFRMPFGRHSKMLLIDLPLTYLEWFSKKGFPQGELGQLMRIVHEIKSGGMEHLFEDLRSRHPILDPDLSKN